MQQTGKNDDFPDTLPIFQFKDTILSTVDREQITIVTAETGAGKSTQVPQYLAEHGYKKIIVTQPRILAARNLCYRVREEQSSRGGIDVNSYVGYRTAHERDDSPETVILYCTDGLQLVREITGSGVRDGQILILDEVHEWNENMEVLVAWAKIRCNEDPSFKVIIMSATIESEKLAAYFGTNAVVTVPGRSHEVVKRRGKDVVSEIKQQIKMGGKNILVFLPGKAEIESVASAIKVDATSQAIPIIPLHSQLESISQQHAFDSYPNGKIILSTNIAQTSVTIDDIDVVIDSGLERRSEVQSGVEGLFIAQVSQADCLQRAGRAGRTKPGEYILAPLSPMPCPALEERPQYGIPEILRKHIDRLALRLANVDMDIETLAFYHEPSHRTIKNAKLTLKSLGAMTPDGKITPLGREMERLPVESTFARMFVEADKYTPQIRLKLAAIIGIQEVGGITKGGSRFTGWRQFTRQTKSDLIAQYDVYIALHSIPATTYDELGIIGKNVVKAGEVMERLDYDLVLHKGALTAVEGDEEELLMKCILAGQTHQLWSVESDGGMLQVGTGVRREISNSTVVSHPRLVVGTPFDLQVTTRKGDLETLHLVQGITMVNADWLVELYPDRYTLHKGKVYYDNERGVLAERQLLKFGGKTYESASAVVLEASTTNRRLFVSLYASWLYEHLERERRHLQRDYRRRIPIISLRQLQQQIQSITPGVVSLSDLTNEQRDKLKSLERLQNQLGDKFMSQLGTSRREERRVQHSWIPRHKRRGHR